MLISAFYPKKKIVYFASFHALELFNQYLFSMRVLLIDTRNIGNKKDSKDKEGTENKKFNRSWENMDGGVLEALNLDKSV